MLIAFVFQIVLKIYEIAFLIVWGIELYGEEPFINEEEF